MNFPTQHRYRVVTLSEAKGLSRWADRCFASLSMTVPTFNGNIHYRRLRSGRGSLSICIIGPTVRPEEFVNLYNLALADAINSVYNIGKHQWNCSTSVEPTRAAVEERPPEMA